MKLLPYASAVLLALLSPLGAAAPNMPDVHSSLRVATFNASMYRPTAGGLATDLRTGDEQARRVAAIVQHLRPDVLALLEFDYDEEHRAADLFRREYLAVGQRGGEPIDYPYVYVAQSNTGVPSGMDLDNDGQDDGPGDSLGYGRFPGQYAFVVYSRYPIDTGRVRTFRTFLWKDMPGARLPDVPATPEPADWYSPEELAVLPLSSKNHVDVPIRAPGGVVHLLVSHPTPPVFDGPEDRNGTRNADEIRLWADYVTPGRGDYLVDDAGQRGGLGAGESFVIAGDLNADPLDGDGTPGAMLQLLNAPRVNGDFVPTGEGGRIDAEALPKTERGNGAPGADTCVMDGRDNLRLDYVLPSRDLAILDGGVFWPAPDEPLAEAVTCSDHRLVWLDIQRAKDIPGLGESAAQHP